MKFSVHYTTRFLFKLAFLQIVFYYPSICLNFKMIGPRIRLGFICTSDDNVRLVCEYRDAIKIRDPGLLEDVEKKHAFFFDDQKESAIYLALICKAPYPVKWEHFQEKWAVNISDNWLFESRFRISTSQRIAPDIEKTGTFSYSSLRLISNHVNKDSNIALGEYTCKGVKKLAAPFHTPSIKMKVFRNRSVYDTAFPMAGKNTTVWLGDTREEDGSVVLPCYVSNPNIKVALYKKTYTLKVLAPRLNTQFTWRGVGGFGLHNKSEDNVNHLIPNTEATWKLIKENENLKFYPHLGFVYYAKRSTAVYPFYPLTPGYYKCSVLPDSDSEDDGSSTPTNNEYDYDGDEVIVKVENGNTPVILHQPVLKPPASYNVTTHPHSHKVFQITCCSASSIPPTLAIVGCFSKEMCMRQLNHFRSLTETTNGNNRLIAKESGNCVKSFNISSMPEYITPINIRCFGDGIDHYETLIFPLDDDMGNESNETSTYSPYTDWEDIDPTKMMTLSLQNMEAKYLNPISSKALHLYDNQNVTFICLCSKSIFSLGIRATINFRNGSRFLVPDERKEEQKYISVFSRSTKFEFNATITSQVQSVSCHGPLADSSKWIEKTLKVHAEMGKAPTIKGDPHEEVTWILNENDRENKLTCEISGAPFPTENDVHWLMDGEAITRQTGGNDNFVYNFTIVRDVNLTILFAKASRYETYEFTCVARNMFGEAQKTFRVYIRPSDEKWTIICVVIGIATFLAIFGMIGAATWRQSKVLRGIKSPFETDDNVTNGFVR